MHVIFNFDFQEKLEASPERTLWLVYVDRLFIVRAQFIVSAITSSRDQIAFLR